MKLHLNKDSNILLIRGYQNGRISIGDDTYSRSVILSPGRLIDDWSPLTLNDLTENDFELMLELEPEVVLLGTGLRLRFPDRAITRPLIQRSIGVEVMDTAAACRTYNVLANEGRNVVASLIIETTAVLQPGQV
ncbi:Mth938-like domain-containing protein [Pseudomonadota bacterium]